MTDLTERREKIPPRLDKVMYEFAAGVGCSLLATGMSEKQASLETILVGSLGLEVNQFLWNYNSP